MHSVRQHRGHTFLHVGDGSARVVQLLVSHESASASVMDALRRVHFGDYVRASGRTTPSPSRHADRQGDELHVHELDLVAQCDPEVSHLIAYMCSLACLHCIFTSSLLHSLLPGGWNKLL